MSTLGHSPERRSQQRSRCLKGARIVLANGNSTIGCRIRSQSDAGLRLLTDGSSVVPRSFKMMQDGSPTGHICEVVWRTQSEIGARIIAPTIVEHKGYNKGVSLLRMRNQHVADRYPV